MPAERTSSMERLESIGVTVFGILLAVFPLALWVAWTPFVFGVVFAVGISSTVLLLVLLARKGDSAENGDTPSTGESRALVPEGFVEEIHRIFPLTYHHSRRGRARYRRTMERLRKQIW